MHADRIESVNFATYTAEELRCLGVKQITNPETFDQFLHPTYGGLYDPALGPVDKDELCETCGLSYVQCPGHFGFIELPLPVYHPMFFQLMLQVLRGSCFQCHRLISKSSRSHLFVKQSELLDDGHLTDALNLVEEYNSFVASASERAATNFCLESDIVAHLNQLCSEFKQRDQEKTDCSKHLVRVKLELNKEFIKKHLLSQCAKTKTCPHCKAPLRGVRAEYNSRIYHQPLGQKIAKKAVSTEAAKKFQKKGEKQGKIKKESQQDGFGEAEQEGEEEQVDEGLGADMTDLLDGDTEEAEPTGADGKSLKSLTQQQFITPQEIKEHMIKLWNTDHKVLKYLFGSHHDPMRQKKVTTPEMFFLDLVAVPPSRFRPLSFMGEKRFENTQTVNLNKVLWDVKLVDEILKRIREDDGKKENVHIPVVLMPTKSFTKKQNSVTIPGKTYKEQLQNAWLKLQSDVNCVMDNTLDKLNKEALPGVRQLLEKKEGLFRKHMMGKRVNYAARSVISPDPYINTDEIGIPEVFASKLTYAQPVTPWNVHQLRQYVMNGPNKYPGAVAVENEDGRITRLAPNDENKREAVAKRLLSKTISDKPLLGEKKVYRHLLNGDVLLLNRQPTLHRPSIMAHKAKVLPRERTLRLHYANCKSYNADFDGDEMNAHFPQNELSRSEAYNLVSTNFNYLSPKDGTPLGGLIQDHVVSGVTLTTRDKFFSKGDYHQLVFGALIDHPGRIKLVPPCIMKPRPYWSGKQIFSTILLNVTPNGMPLLTMKGKPKVSDNDWPKGKVGKVLRGDGQLYLENHIKDPYLLENQVIIRGGELVTGILDKSQYGATPHGLVHNVYELYGGAISGLLMSVLARLFTVYLQHHGFTLGIEDILVESPADVKRKEIMQEAKTCGDAAALEALNVTSNNKDELLSRLRKAQFSNQGVELKQLDLGIKSKTDQYNNKINTTCIRGLRKKFPENCLQLMVKSGAKGSSVNCMQISCLLGQIELEGRRPPLSMSGRSLPSFVPYDTSPRAGGFVDGRFLTGIRPQEYFFHCMAGREGLIDTAVKTSRSGYLQRCLIKHLEALYVQYDMTVRDGDGSIVQFLYGDDGVDVLKSPYIKSGQYKTIAENYETYLTLLKPNEIGEAVDLKKAMKLQRKIDRWKKRNGDTYSTYFNHCKKSPFHAYEDEYREQVKNNNDGKRSKVDRKEMNSMIIRDWRETEKERYLSQTAPCPEPVLSKYTPCRYFGSVSEKFRKDVEGYIFTNPDSIFQDEEKERNSGKLASERFLPLMLVKYLKSLVEPGEAVGLLAGQSIGEPSTQMTLNTFHFAGRGEVNVTLGIPRLREILMTASANIKTPTMDVLVKPGCEQEAKNLVKSLNKLVLMQVLSKITVHESLQMCKVDRFRCREFKVRLDFLPKDTYEDDYDINPADIIAYVEQVFLKRIVTAVTKVIRLKEKQKLLNTQPEDNPYTRRGAHLNEEGEEVAANEEEADDQADLSDDDIAGDGDASDLKSMNRKLQRTSYDDPEAAQSEMLEDASNDSFSQNYVEILVDPDDQSTEPMQITVKKEPCLTAVNARVQEILRRDRHIVGYMVDEQNQWCEATLQFPLSGSKVMLISVVEKLAEKSVVRESPGIQRCVVSESKNPGEGGRYRMRTEGVNVSELRKYPEILDLNTLYTNNIHSMAATYGVEAARRVIIKEVQDVFKVYGIQIDARHLSLIGDYMTFEGVYKPFNRVGIESSPSPFQKMSFETSMHFLRSATAFGQPDELGSPSSRLVVGRSIRAGTGMMDLIPRLTPIISNG